MGSERAMDKLLLRETSFVEFCGAKVKVGKVLSLNNALLMLCVT